MSQSVDLSPSLYSQLDELVAFRFHVKQKKLSQKNRLFTTQDGQHQAQRKGRGMTFNEVRQYQPGDDIRHIDWRVTARTQKTHTKVFTEEHERPVIIVTEQTSALFFGSQVRLKTAQALNLTAILAWTALHQGERVGGFSFNDSHQAWTAPKRSQHTVLRSLQEAVQLQSVLTRPGQSDSQTWQQPLKHLSQVVKPGSKLFLIGDLLQLSEQSLAMIRNVSRHSEVIAIHLFDPLEKKLPKLGWLSLTLSFETDPLLKLDSFRRKTRDNYAEIYAQQWQTMQEQFRQMKLPLLEIGTHEDPLESLMRLKVLV